MPELKFKRITDNEIHLTDPNTGGVWRVISPHSISEEGVLIAIEQTLREKNVQPAKDGMVTIEYSIKVQEQGDTVHPVFDDILAQLSQALQKRDR